MFYSLFKIDKGQLSERAGRKVMDLRQMICYGRQTAGFLFGKSF